MAYLLAWRMALAKDLLRQNKTSVAKIAERVGYSSASTFSAAFSRHAGRTPSQFANAHTSAVVAEHR
jgi:AraC-like DNA-binding protein